MVGRDSVEEIQVFLFIFSGRYPFDDRRLEIVDVDHVARLELGHVILAVPGGEQVRLFRDVEQHPGHLRVVRGSVGRDIPVHVFDKDIS